MAALRAPFMRWRVVLPISVLVVGLLIALFVIEPLALVLIEDRTADAVLFDPSSAADPIMLQHVIWFLRHPETLAQFTGVIGLIICPWAFAVWLTAENGPVRWSIGFARYWRLFVIPCLALVPSMLMPLLSLVGFRVPDIFWRLGFVASDLLFIYIVLRLSGALSGVVKGDGLRLREGWRATQSVRGVCIWLAVDLYLIALILNLILTLMAAGVFEIVLMASGYESVWSLSHWVIPFGEVFLLCGDVFMSFVMIAATCIVARKVATADMS